MSFDYYANPHPVAYSDEIQAPVPGWGMTPNLAGSRIIGIGATDPLSWWSEMSTMKKVLLVGGSAIALGAAWYFLMGPGAKKYEENLSLEDVKHHAKRAGKAMRRGYEAAKPHAKRLGRAAAKKAKLGYEASKPHLKRAAKATKKVAARSVAKGAKKAALLLTSAAEHAEQTAKE